MARVKVNFGGPFNEILNSASTRAEVTARAERVLSAAKSAASGYIDTGAYYNGLTIVQDSTDRAVARVTSQVPHSHLVEARHGTLARALDAAGGN